ncbi:MAG: class I SAM-dependent DNA methyltransferase [Lysobacter sp.]|nr:class I SAM-dependent DNA methyltransferase [Lysobacter sp.]
MPLSWNEIKARAIAFAKEWEDEASEDAEAKSFWDGFFTVFGVNRRRIASFEVPIKREDGSGGFIDLLWKGILLVEHKSLGKDLDRAFGQARDYFPGLKDRDLPRYVLVSDFQHFRLYDLDTGEQHAFALKELHRHIRLFGFIAGYQSRSFKDQDPVNIKAAERMGKLHDVLRDDGYTGHKLEVLLVRILFCLFAEDTGIFEPRRRFQDFVEQRTNEDGSDLGGHLATLFDVLDTPLDQRQKGLDEQVAGFPYVNGKLFSERLPPAAFNPNMRERLLDACGLHWGEISPAIFGALFQSIMDAKARRNLGAHYTSERNILKLIGPLFLDELRSEFTRARASRIKLHEFHEKIAGLKFLDPACGCGNFLVIAYRELRHLELEVIDALYQKDQEAGQVVDPRLLIKCNVDQFYGIEIEEFPAQIAQLALWLVDHQVNLRVSELFGNPFERLPLTASARIVHGNALQVDWKDVVAAEELDYILGNPPFVGSKLMDPDQRADLLSAAGNLKGAGTLDLVAAWYLKAAAYIQAKPSIRCAFVSTNSITQGEQVGVLWGQLLARGVRIHFAHRTFLWNNEARGVAAVHCVIIGFGLQSIALRRLFDYATSRAEPHEITVTNINPYLVDAADIVLGKRGKPICLVPEIGIGNKPIDGGYLLLSPDERAALLAQEPLASRFLRRWYGATEYLNDEERWCLWLAEASPVEIRSMPIVKGLVDKVRRFRLGEIDAKSGRKAKAGESSLALANTPTRFHVERVPTSDFLLIPRHSSELRPFIPMGFMGADSLSGDANLISADATQYHFGVMQSTMHMAWVRAVCGRIKSDFRYSASIVYNNFPWPEAPNDTQREAIEAAAQTVLDVRSKFPDSSLADLYDPSAMPAELVKAHRALDRAVDGAYGRRKFTTDADRVAFLFERYESLMLLPPVPKPRKGRSKATA